MAVTPGLPTRFPCWVRATYSWGGETDKDLGFIEGDLIECLNAGDGSWWMGRLRRDRRIMGLFPSNFVVVLDDSFVPVSRSVSPLSDLHKSNSGSRNSLERIQQKKERAKARRPFQGYKTAKYPGPETPASTPPSNNSPALKPQPDYDPANPPSTVLWQQRPEPRTRSRSPSPLVYEDIGSSPPPPPPPAHRYVYANEYPSDNRYMQGRTPSPQPQQMISSGYHQYSRTPSPGPESLQGHTPPMLRSAIDDVMSRLEDMSVSQYQGPEPEYEPEPQPIPHHDVDPWSPEAFGDFRRPEKPSQRPITSMGLTHGGSTYSEPRINSYSSRHQSPDRFNEPQPQLQTYVQRMESQLRHMQEARDAHNSRFEMTEVAPAPPPKAESWISRPTSAIGRRLSTRKRKSAYELGQQGDLSRTYTTKTNSTNSTNSSSGVQSVATNQSGQSSMTSQSLMSGFSAGGFSATSAGSLARRNKFGSIREKVSGRPQTSSGMRDAQREWEPDYDLRPQTPSSQSIHQSVTTDRAGASSAIGWQDERPTTSSGGLGGFTTPKQKKQGFFKKLVDSSKASFAGTRTTIGGGQPTSRPGSPTKTIGIAGGMMRGHSPKKSISSMNNDPKYGRSAASEMGLMSAAGNDWLMTRRDVNRSNTPGPSEREDRARRCQMHDQPVIRPVEEMYKSVEGDEGADGGPVYSPFQLSNPSFSQIDKAARLTTSLPSSITAGGLATSYVCRPYRSDVQRLRAIFIWCAERISWEEDAQYESYDMRQNVDTRYVIQSKRGSSREVAALVFEMCSAIGIHVEMINGYLKTPGEDIDLDAIARPNHFWNAVLVDGEWRFMDASLASPTNPKRSKYSSVSTSIAEAWYFLTKPGELCWTHIPVDHQEQHMIPGVSPDVLLALPGVCPPFFRLGLGVHNYDTSIIRLEGLEVCALAINTPTDVEIIAEVEAKTYLRDQDGDLYEDTENTTKKRALSQPSWYKLPSAQGSFDTSQTQMQKRYLVKALLPPDTFQAVLKIYAGKKGLMHSARDNPHPLALSLPLYHTRDNPAYDFVKRHPTPHATRHDLYLVQPQCWRLGLGETYVFCVRQHNASTATTPAVEQSGFDFSTQSTGALNGVPFRPASALSMSSSAAGSYSSSSDPTLYGAPPTPLSMVSSASSNSSTTQVAPGVRLKDIKPAKLAIQSPTGKIIRLNRKHEGSSGLGVGQSSGSKQIDGEVCGSVWEVTVKVIEPGVWRGLVLADRSARWCVWCEWESF